MSRLIVSRLCQLREHRRAQRTLLPVALILVAVTVTAVHADQVCPSPTSVTPLTDPDSGKTCNPGACTPAFCTRGDIAPLGQPATQELQDRLVTLDCSPHSIAPVQVFAEADPVTRKSQLFQYYLLDNTGFQPSVFTTKIPGVNDDPSTQKTVWGANCGLPTIGAVRLAVEPKPGLPADPDNPRAFTKDAALLARMGSGNNVPGNFFTVDGTAPHVPDPSDTFPTRVANVVPIQLSMGAYNALQQADAHNYWEFNYTTNWIHPLYELPFAGGFPDKAATDPADTYRDGEIGALASIVPGDGPGANQVPKNAVALGDNPDRPRDPDLFDSDVDAQREFRERFVPSGIAREALLNVFERLDSFEQAQHNLTQRLLDGYKAAIALADANHDGVISAAEGDIDTCNANCFPATPSDECPISDSSCLFLLPRSYNRFAVTREINDGLLAPRFAPSTRGWALSGVIHTGFPAIPASEGEDADDR